MYFKEMKKFYNKKKIFLTGHTGFKGAYLSLLLKDLGADIVGYSLEPEKDENLFRLMNVEQDVVSIIGDIADYNKIEEAIVSSKADMVFHLAAQPLVRRSYIDSNKTFETNVMGTVNLLEAVRKSETVQAVVNITTDKCYENKEWIWPYRESDPLGGYDPYSASKACSEIVTSSYRNSFFKGQNIKVATARAGNVIGGGDFSDDRIIPDVFDSYRTNTELVLRFPDAIRPWQHVLDVLWGYLLLGVRLWSDEDGAYQSAFNFSPSSENNISVEDIVKKCFSAFGGGKYKCEIKDSNYHEANILKLDSSKSREMLEWTAILDIDKSIFLTANWYKMYFEDKNNIVKNTKNQISQYLAIRNGGDL